MKHLLTSVLFFISLTSTGQHAYERIKSFNHSFTPDGINYGDLNNDGYDDVIVYYYDKDYLSIIPNNPENGFLAPININLGFISSQRVLKLGDMNNDGFLDLIITDNDNMQVGVIINEENMDFSDAVYYLVQGYPKGLFVNDFDLDGFHDFAVVSHNPPNNLMTIFSADGSGGFSEENFPIADPLLVNGGDFDNDGDVDLVLSSHEENKLLIYESNNGFALKESIFLDVAATNIQVNDLNNDGDFDIIFTTANHSNFHYLLGKNNFSFDPPVAINVGQTISERDFIVDDVNSDGIKDVVLPTWGYDVLFAIGDIGNTFSITTSSLANDGGSGFLGLYYTDLENQGKKGILNLNLSSKLFYENQFDETFTFTQRLEAPIGSNYKNIRAGDINGDGIQDLIIANYHLSFLSYLKGTGNLNYEVVRNIQLKNSADRLKLVDVTNDGMLDIVTVDAGLTGGEVLVNDGQGNFTTTHEVNDGYEYAVADFNNDLLPEVIIGENLYLNEGGGVFTLANTFNGISKLETLDINSDNNLDIIFTRNNETFVLLGNGDNTFEPENNIGATGYFVDKGDLNNDGIEDIFLYDYVTQKGELLYGDGTSLISSNLEVDAYGLSSNQKIFDLDHNDTLDIVFGTTNGLKYFYVNKEGIFSEAFLSARSNMQVYELSHDHFLNDSTEGVALITANNIFEIHTEKTLAEIEFINLSRSYTGIMIEDAVLVNPSEVNYTITYAGNSIRPVNSGKYLLEVKINDEAYKGSATDTLFINKVPITITATDLNKVYGDENPELIFVYDGLVNNETEDLLDEVPSISTTAELFSEVGEYEIELIGGADNNYEYQLVNGTLTVEKRALTITAHDFAITYGETLPAFTLSYDNLPEGKTFEDLETQPTISSTVTDDSKSGEFPIIVEGAVDPNYEITHINGVFTIHKAPLTFTALSYEIMEDEPLPEIDYTITGFVKNEDENVLDELPVLSTSATEGSGPGEYTIEFSDGNDDAYEFNFISGVLTIRKVTGINDTGNFIVTFFPNPAKDKINIHTYIEIRSIKIYDLKGRVLHESSTSETLDISGFERQVYVIEILLIDGIKITSRFLVE